MRGEKKKTAMKIKSIMHVLRCYSTPATKKYTAKMQQQERINDAMGLCVATTNAIAIFFLCMYALSFATKFRRNPNILPKFEQFRLFSLIDLALNLGIWLFNLFLFLSLFLFLFLYMQSSHIDVMLCCAIKFSSALSCFIL